MAVHKDGVIRYVIAKNETLNVIARSDSDVAISQNNYIKQLTQTIMKRFSILSCMAAALMMLAGCEQTGNDGYEGTNYIYLESEGGQTTILESDTTPLEIEVMLSTSLSEDLTLAFAVNGPEGVVELQNNPVTIKAGEKTGSFQIVSLNAGKLTEAANFTVALDAATNVLPKSVALKNTFAFVVNPAPAESELTTEQLAIIAAYKETTGIDLAKYIGELNVSVEYTAYDFVNEELLEPETFTGKTVITLSETSTAEAPVLKMVSNPMGIQDKMYALLRALTVEYEDYWCDGEYFPDNVNLMTAIKWNKDSQELFSMSLDGITFGADGAIEFVGTGVDQYEDEIAIVPFSYEFTAYARELKAIEDGTFVKEDEYASDCTANPAYHLNNSDISEDLYEEENYAESTAEILENGNLVFTFCMATAMDSDYTKVIATYTPNN